MDNQIITFSWILITIISSVASGIIGVVISIIYYKKQQKYQAKMETFKSLVGNRFDLRGDQFSKALNEIFVVFQDSKNVLHKLKEFHDNILIPTSSLKDDKFIELFKAMCKDLGIDSSQYSESFFMKPFNPKANCTVQRNSI